MAEPITQVLGVVGMKTRGEYNSETTYEKLNVVTYNGSSYCAKTDTQGNLPTNTLYWDLIAEKGDKGEKGDTPVKGTDYYTAADKAELEETLSTDVSSEVTGQLSNLTSATPIAVNSTSGMTDTSRIYVLTTDGHWYWYNGSSWIDGGVYQAIILDNEEVDYLNIDKILKSPYLVNYDPISLGQLTSGKYIVKNSSDILVFNDNAVWGYYEYDINQNDVNKILDYTVTNYNNQCGIFIVDEDNKVLHQSIYHQNNKFETVHGKIKITADMKKIYLQRNLGPITNPASNYVYNRINYASINFISSLSPIVNYNEKSKLEAINEIENGYIRYTNAVTADNIPFVTYFNGNWSVKTYRIEKGNRYYVVGTNRGESTSYIITNNDYIAQEISSVGHEQDTLVSKDFVATFDGYIITTEVETGATTNVYIYDSFKSDTLDFSNIKIGFTGDSICRGDGYLGGYAKILNEKYNLQYQNIGVSGGHLAHDKPNLPFVISESINNLDNDCDAYIIEGGINDFVNQVPIGTITSNYTDTITNTTIIGALEKTFRDLYTYHAGKRFAFLIIHNVNNYYLTSNGANTTWKDYREAIYSVCKKYGIKVIDIGEESMNTYNDTVAQTYTAVGGDRLHPNKAGYEKFYVPAIKKWIINELDN